jgi:uncharacterized protein (DUF488 family)
MKKRVIHLYTIGFTKKTAEEFFGKLRQHGVKRLVDIRRNNVSQLAGFTKKQDLEFFLREIGGIEYVHMLEFAPTQEMMDAYRRNKGDWKTYEREFNKLIASRKIEKVVTPVFLDYACLLCSEAEPDQCHRRLVAEYLRNKSKHVELKVTHL